mgnify:CR=1 FL=1
MRIYAIGDIHGCIEKLRRLEEAIVAGGSSIAEQTGARVGARLVVLRLGGLVQTRRVGRSVIYRVDDGHLNRLVFESLNHADHQMTGEPAHE